MDIIYTTPKKYVKYDKDHYLLYLNETIIENYIPNDCEIAAVTAYKYAGDQEDGATKINATEVEYGAFVAGLIRKRYSESDAEAIQSNMLVAVSQPSHSRAVEFLEEFNVYQRYREECKAKIATLLS